MPLTGTVLAVSKYSKNSWDRKVSNYGNQELITLYRKYIQHSHSSVY
jgi:hypothetical protein